MSSNLIYKPNIDLLNHLAYIKSASPMIGMNQHYTKQVLKKNILPAYFSFVHFTGSMKEGRE